LSFRPVCAYRARGNRREACIHLADDLVGRVW
jgi:hypothetical protein